ncbi:hypothetical protein XELAEV_18010828mg [Xenopus laevis]|uniref:Uncharacterized protein n=1 Tax=Xenopus laevis TaxID=8355 RepID=A0A974DUZ1_XENLA|nr:hypothetical protein XELAEV_18010828mg [Xenopus laevis]
MLKPSKFPSHISLFHLSVQQKKVVRLSISQQWFLTSSKEIILNNKVLSVSLKVRRSYRIPDSNEVVYRIHAASDYTKDVKLPFVEPRFRTVKPRTIPWP